MYMDTSGSSNNFDTEYGRLAAQPGYQELASYARIFAIWDDHDFGRNDVGEEYTRKVESQEAFVRFWNPPATSRTRTGTGIYDSTILGTAGRRVQIIRLDTRYFRSPLKRGSSGYEPDTTAGKTFLGAAQWTWLEQQLRQRAEIRIICSSIQIIPTQHGGEKWFNFPPERTRLLNLIRSTGATGVVMVSGDRHFAELSTTNEYGGYPLYELTASALNNSSASYRLGETNPNRLAGMFTGNNFGTIQIDWTQSNPVIRLQIRDEFNEIVAQKRLRLGDLRSVPTF